MGLGIWESRGRRAGPGEEYGIWPHRVQASLRALPVQGTPNQGSYDHYPSQNDSGRGVALWLQPKSLCTCTVFHPFTLPLRLPRTPTGTHGHASVIVAMCTYNTIRSMEEKRLFFPLQVRRVHRPRLRLLWPHANIPASSLDMFPQVSRLL